MSQDDIWDDSALIASWEEAVVEYKKYHSIAAKGQDVEEALRLYEETQNAEVEAEAEAEPETQPETDTEIPTAAAIPSPGPSTSVPIPETLLAKSDDAMKSLMMSWYYAGYYTGRLEGRREALAEVQKS